MALVPVQVLLVPLLPRPDKILSAAAQSHLATSHRVQADRLASSLLATPANPAGASGKLCESLVAATLLPLPQPLPQLHLQLRSALHQKKQLPSREAVTYLQRSEARLLVPTLLLRLPSRQVRRQSAGPHVGEKARTEETLLPQLVEAPTGHPAREAVPAAVRAAVEHTGLLVPGGDKGVTTSVC